MRLAAAPGRAPPHQNDGPGRARCEMLRDLEAEAAEPAGDEVGAVAADDAVEAADRRIGRPLLVLRHDDLSDMTRLRHQPEGVLELRHREVVPGRRTEAAAFERGAKLAQHLAHHLRPLGAEAIEVNGEVAEVLPEAAERQAAVRVDVHLADLDEPAIRLQARDAALDGLAGQRVDHHVDAAPAGQRPHLVGECDGAQIHHVPDAERAKMIALRLASGRREDLRADVLRNLDGGETDAARRGVDEDALAFGEAREPNERVPAP